MRRREFLGLVLLAPVTARHVTACALFRPPHRLAGADSDTVTEDSDRFAAAPSSDVIQGIADTPSSAWLMIYASLPVPGDRHVW